MNKVVRAVRCAIYTRKSSEEGLEQDFNSLNAQYEACAAYVTSQVSERWSLVGERYDDGGISGGSLDRPALQRLLNDVKNDRIDIIVVYKVDRLTRSLLDFAKLVEAFDAAGVSFVSVTQSFNTTTSMGRLTLNMLLSFAQFEREVTAERIRDKIAASKARGLWMGGTPPLGYKPHGRSLAIVESQASIVRDIFARYRQLGNVRSLVESLQKDGIVSPKRKTGTGKSYGGVCFSRGKVYHLLKNPIYVGDIPHKGTVYPGKHPAIIDRETFDAVQAQLAANGQTRKVKRRASEAILARRLFDEVGEPLVPVHASKGTVRYRYYVNRSHHLGEADDASSSLRLPAREIEQVVAKALAEVFADPLALAGELSIALTPHRLQRLREGAAKLAALCGREDRDTIRALVSRIVVNPERLVFSLSAHAINDTVGIDTDLPAQATITRTLAVRLTRTGRVLRYVDRAGVLALPSQPDDRILALLGRARRYQRILAKGNLDVASLARHERVNPSYLTRIVRLAFLAPDVIEAALSGELRAGADASALLQIGAVDADWGLQRKRLLV